MTAMAELDEAKANLRAALLRGVKGTLADERADELIDRYQTALKAAHGEKVLTEAAQLLYGYPTYRGVMRVAGDLINPGIDNLPYCATEHHSHPARECPDLIDPEVTE